MSGRGERAAASRAARAASSGPHHLRALSLAAFMAAAGTLHFVVPQGYELLIPRTLPEGWRGPLVAGSGVAELAAAALVAVPRTRRFGGFFTAALLVAVFPANVSHALRGGIPGGPLLLQSPELAWVRLPLQAPLVWWAWLTARDARRN